VDLHDGLGALVHIVGHRNVVEFQHAIEHPLEPSQSDHYHANGDSLVDLGDGESVCGRCGGGVMLTRGNNGCLDDRE